MPDPVLIEFRTDLTQLEAAVDELERLGLVDKQVAEESRKAAASLRAQNDEMAKQGKTVKDLKLNVNDLVEAMKDVPDEIISEEQRKIMDATGQSTKKLTTELRAMKDELARLEIAGKRNTAEYQKLAAQAGALEDQIGDVSAAVRVLASDTKNLDALIGAVQGLAGGFAVVQGAAALFGNENEELQKQLLKVNAAMSILQGLQTVQTVLQKQSALSVVLNTNAQKAYNFVVGTSTGLLKAFRIALAATGIGLIIFALYEAAKAFGVFGSSVDDTNEKLKEQQEVLEATRQKYRDYADEISARRNLELNDLRREIQLKQAQGASDQELLEMRLDLLNREKAALIERRATLNDDVEETKRVNDAIAQIETDKAVLIAQQANKIAENARKLREKDLEETKKAAQGIIDLYAGLLETIQKEQIAKAQEEVLKGVFDGFQFAGDQLEGALKVPEDFYERLAELSEESKENTIKDLEEIEAKRREIFDMSVSVAQDSFNIIGQINQVALDNELNNLQAQLDNKLISQQQYEQQVAAAKRKSARDDKALALFEAIVNTAAAIVQALPNIPLSILAGVMGAAQIGIIASQPIPAFAKGTKNAPAGFKWVGEEGPELINDGGGYPIITNKESMALASIAEKYALPMMRIPDMPDFNSMGSLLASGVGIPSMEGMNYEKMAKAFSKEVRKNPGVKVNIDQDGFEVYMKSALSKSEFLDKRYTS